MKKTNRSIKSLNVVVSASVRYFKPPENLTVSSWADKYRRLSPENSAEAGPWRTSRTPYMKEIMDCFSDPKINRIVVVASSQIGKTELEMNMIGYAIDIDPGPIMFVHPTLDAAKDFSKRRIAPMIRDCKHLRDKISDAKSRDGDNTVFKKSYPGGMLTMTGSNSPASLASIPARYVFGDERDRWAISAGTEGDPWKLLEARTKTFYNSKMVEVSTPTIKGASAIEYSYDLGTQERWCHECPHCGEYHDIIFKNIYFDHDFKKVNHKKIYEVSNVLWGCPSCGGLSTEGEMRKQPAKWIATNISAYQNGIRSFWINAFASPWESWSRICLEFLQAKNDPEKLKVVYNTMLGELWEDRGAMEDEDALMARREEYEAELPEGVLCLTCGVDTQDDRLEYEVLGHGHYGETWGIKKGFITGKPDTKDVWERLDIVLDRTYKFKDDKGLNISFTCIDSGGHYTQEVYTECRKRFSKRVFAIKGRGGEGIPFTNPAKKIPIRQNKKITCYLYSLGVDAGKASIMSALRAKEAGPKYSHFPKAEEQGYDTSFFKGLLSEKLSLKRVNGKDKWMWEKLPGHARNEALDCRNYALAAFRILSPDLDKIEKMLKGVEPPKKIPKMPKSRVKKNKIQSDDW